MSLPATNRRSERPPASTTKDVVMTRTLAHARLSLQDESGRPQVSRTDGPYQRGPLNHGTGGLRQEPQAAVKQRPVDRQPRASRVVAKSENTGSPVSHWLSTPRQGRTPGRVEHRAQAERSKQMNAIGGEHLRSVLADQTAHQPAIPAGPHGSEVGHRGFRPALLPRRPHRSRADSLPVNDLGTCRIASPLGSAPRDSGGRQARIAPSSAAETWIPLASTFTVIIPNLLTNCTSRAWSTEGSSGRCQS